MAFDRKEFNRRWRELNREKLRERQRAAYQANPERFRARQRVKGSKYRRRTGSWRQRLPAPRTLQQLLERLSHWSPRASVLDRRAAEACERLADHDAWLESLDEQGA